MTAEWDVWVQRTRAARAVQVAASAIRRRPGGDTVIGAQQLVDALDAYWQARYGGRVVIVAGEPE